MSTFAKILEKFEVEHLLPSGLFNKLIEDTGVKVEEDDESFYDPLYPDFEDFNLKHDTSVSTPIYLNDFDFNIQDDRDAIINLLRTQYEDNSFDTVASCQCGKYRSNIYLDSGLICEECGTEPIKPLSNKIETKIWLKRPAQVSGFINPAMYMTFFSLLTTKTPKVPIIEYWINPVLRAEKRFKDPNNNSFKIACHLEQFRESLGIPFGYNSFVENVDLIIRSIVETDMCKIADINNKNRKNFSDFWQRYKSKAIFDYLPLPNKITAVVEDDKRNKYVSKEQTELNNIYFTIADTYSEDDVRVSENNELMGKNYKALVNAMAEVQKNILFGKKGMIRYNAGAGKLPLTGRSVITGESGVCRSDTIVLPWLYGLTCLDKHLTNWLYRKGYTPLQVKKIIRTAANYRHPLVEEFFTWIESNRFAMAISGRNPSIQYLSARAFFVQFSRDLDDKSIRIPITTVKEYGADFDGKHLNAVVKIFQLLETRKA